MKGGMSLKRSRSNVHIAALFVNAIKYLHFHKESDFRYHIIQPLYLITGKKNPLRRLKFLLEFIHSRLSIH